MIKFENIIIRDRVKDWMEAVRIAAQPLLDEKIITPNYVEKMIETVKEMGAYIVISKDVAIPHARPEDGARETAISLLKLKERVAFSDSKEVNTIIVLASSNSNGHIELLKKLSLILSQKEKYEKLIETQDQKTIFAILEGKEV